MALVVKSLPANAGDKTDSGSIPGSGRSPGGGNGNPLQDRCIENAWTEEPSGVQAVESQSHTAERLTHASTHMD